MKWITSKAKFSSRSCRVSSKPGSVPARRKPTRNRSHGVPCSKSPPARAVAMKLVFAGTPKFAAVSLAALLRARHDITLVLTRPDRPAGRGLKPHHSPVKRLALEYGLEVFQPAS